LRWHVLIVVCFVVQPAMLLFRLFPMNSACPPLSLALRFATSKVNRWQFEVSGENWDDAINAILENSIFINFRLSFTSATDLQGSVMD